MDNGSIKIMERLGLDYSPAIQSTENFKKTIKDLNKELNDLKKVSKDTSNAIGKEMSKEISSGFGSLSKDLKKPFDDLVKESVKAAMPVKELGGTLEGVGKSSEKMGESLITSASKFYAITRGASEAIETIKKVETGMTEISRVMSDSSFQFNEYRDRLFELGTEYGQTFENAQQTALRWVQSGYNVADSLKLTEDSLLALNAAELDATSATESMIGIMSQWNLEANQLVDIMDKINKTADTHAATSQDLVDGLLRSSGAARTMNMSIEETIALLVNMREASGRTGKEVGNALNSILSYMQRPAAIKAFEDMGINMFADSAKTQFRNVLDIFDDMAGKWGTLDKEISDGFLKSADAAEFFNEELAVALGMQEEWNDLQKRDVSSAAAGVTRRNYFIGILERMTSTQSALNNMMDAGGYSAQKNADTMATLEKKNQSLKTSVDQLVVSMGDAGLGGTLKVLADGGTKALQLLNKLPKPAKDVITAFVSLNLTIKALDSGLSLIGGKGPILSSFFQLLSGGIANVQANALGLGAALKAGLASNVTLLAITGTIAAVTALYNSYKKTREEAERFIATTEQNIETFNEEKEGLQNLSKEYDELKSKQKNLSATAEDKERLAQIQKELVELYDVSVTGINAEGEAYSDSSTAIQQRIADLEYLAKTEREVLDSALEGKDPENVKTLEKGLEKRKQILQEIINVQEQLDKYNQILKDEATKSTDDRGYDAEEESRNRRIKGMVHSLNQERANLKASLADINTDITEATDDRKRLLRRDAMEMLQAMDENGEVVTDSVRNYASTLADAFAQIPEDIHTVRDEMQQAIQAFAASDFNDWVEKYQAAMSAGDFSGMDEAASKIRELVREFTEGKPELEAFADAMNEAFGSSSSMNSAELGANNYADAMKNMRTITRDTIEELTDLDAALSDVRNKKDLSIDTILDLVEKYGLSMDAIQETTNGYTIEEGALENLRQAKIQTANDGIQAELATANGVKKYVQERIQAYGLEIAQLNNLAKARAAMYGVASKRASAKAEIADLMSFKDPFNEPKMFSKDDIKTQAYVSAFKKKKKSIDGMLKEYESAVNFLEMSEKETKKLMGMVAKSGSGRSKIPTTKKGKKSKKEKKEKYENKALDEAIALLEHRKRISEETQLRLQQELLELHRINEAYVNTEEERRDLAERIYAVEKRLQDRRLQDSSDWISRKKSFNDLTLAEEVAAWERIRKNQSDNIEAMKQSELSLYQLRKQIREKHYREEEGQIKHLTTLGLLSAKEQIEQYKRL